MQLCSDAYRQYEFHKVYHGVNQFCAVDLSSLYIDITKGPDVLRCPLLPPKTRHPDCPLQYFRYTRPLDRSNSRLHGRRGMGALREIDLRPFGKVSEIRSCANRSTGAIADTDALLDARSIVAQSIEVARQQKLIGNALEAHVVLSLTAGESSPSIEHQRN